uniref:Spindle pole body component n=1 Tax=Echinostoma caproni TaxID=27848 RepID=A0A183BB29_9TREM
LNQLEVNYDPTWLCLLRFKEWLVDRLHLYQRLYRQAIGSITSGTTSPSAVQAPTGSVPNERSMLSPDENATLGLDESEHSVY